MKRFLVNFAKGFAIVCLLAIGEFAIGVLIGLGILWLLT